jgi:hypothetical protein
MRNSTSTLKNTNAAISTTYARFTCTGTPTNKVISSITPYKFIVNPSISIPLNGYLIVTFPLKWADSS